jgi:hypothetical protein
MVLMLEKLVLKIQKTVYLYISSNRSNLIAFLIDDIGFSLFEFIDLRSIYPRGHDFEKQAMLGTKLVIFPAGSKKTVLCC